MVGESVADFVAELRRLARNCQFGDFLDEALRDRLVCGLQNEAIQRRLLTEAKLTFAGALELAKAQEAAELQAKQFKDPDIGRFINYQEQGFLKRIQESNALIVDEEIILQINAG